MLVSIGSRADAPADAALRAARRRRREAGAVRRLGDAGPVRRRASRSTGRCGPTRASSTSRTWARSRSRGRRRASSCRRCSRTTSTRLEVGEAQYTLLTNETGGIIDDLIVYRDRRAAATCSSSTPRTARPTSRWLVGARDRAARTSATSRTSTRCSPCRGRARSSGSGSSAGRPFTLGDRRARRRRGDGQPHRLHRRGGVELALHARGRAGALGRDPRARRQSRAGSARATRCGSRSATRCTATTSARSGTRSRAGSAGSARSTPSSRASSRCARSRRAGPERKLVAFRMTEQAIPRQGMAIEGGGEVTSGSLSPMLEVGIGLGYVPVGAERARHRARRSTSAAGRAAREVVDETDLQARGVSMAAAESYPDDLLYHPEHDWARIDGDEAVLGVTWFAVDSLGELVHFEPPGGRPTGSAKDGSYGEVESVKAVSDADRAALGRGARGERGRRRRARDRQRGPLRRRAGSSGSGSASPARPTRCSTPPRTAR